MSKATPSDGLGDRKLRPHLVSTVLDKPLKTTERGLYTLGTHALKGLGWVGWVGLGWVGCVWVEREASMAGEGQGIKATHTPGACARAIALTVSCVARIVMTIILPLSIVPLKQ